MICASVLLPASASELKIQLTPQPLVLSSDTDTLTINTNVTFYAVDYAAVTMGNEMKPVISTAADNSEKLVVRCSKNEVKKAISGRDSPGTEILVTLTIDCDGVEYSATQVLGVTK